MPCSGWVPVVLQNPVRAFLLFSRLLGGRGKTDGGKAGGGVGHGLKAGHVGAGGGDNVELGQGQHGDILLQNALHFLVDPLTSSSSTSLLL